MKISLLIDQAFEASLWCRALIESIYAGAKRHKIELQIIYDPQHISGAFVLILSMSPEYIEMALKAVSHKPVHPVLLTEVAHQQEMRCSMVTHDYAQGVKSLLQVLHAENADRIALFAVNHHSCTDLAKATYYLKYETDCTKADIFENSGNLLACCEAFLPHLEQYDGVLCANDAGAIVLHHMVKRMGRTRNRSLAIACFGNMHLAHHITMAELDYKALGEEMVSACVYLAKHRALTHIQLALQCQLFMGERAGMASLAVLPESQEAQRPNQSIARDFCEDTAVQRMMRVETIFETCDTHDIGIVRGILQGKTYSSISEKEYLSENAVKYRVKRLMRLTATQNKQEFQRFWQQFQDLF